ncbi:MAG: methyltransferase domain-containing protein [Candidatus Njordarchaeales archaeon]
MTKLLRCIRCHGDLTLRDNKSLICLNCNQEYKIVNDIPVMLPSRELESAEEVRIFNELVERYDKWFFSEKGAVLFRNEVKAIKYALEGINVRKSVEIGVGTGMFAKALNIEYGIDPAWKPLLLARQRGIKVVQGVAENLPFKSTLFDAAFLIVTICFLREPLKALLEIRRILKRGGYLIIGFIDRNSPWGRFYLRKKERKHPFYKVAKFYSVEEIEEILKDLDFRIHKLVSTLFRSPLQTPTYEEPVNGLVPQAGFKIIVARKT